MTGLDESGAAGVASTAAAGAGFGSAATGAVGAAATAADGIGCASTASADVASAGTADAEKAASAAAAASVRDALTGSWMGTPVAGLLRVGVLGTLAAMELMCALVILWIVDDRVSLGLNLVTLAVLLPVALVVGLAVEHRRSSRGGRFLPTILAWVVAVAAITTVAMTSGLFVTQPEGGRLAGLLCGVVLWGLGTRLSLLRVRFATVVGEFQFGLVILLTALFTGHHLEASVPFAVVVGPAYVTLGMVGLGLARSGGRAGGSLRRGSWLLVAAGVLVVLVLSAALTALLTPEALRAMGRAIAWLWAQVERVFAAVASWFPDDTPAGSEGPGWGSPGGGAEETVGGQVLPESVLSVVRAGYTVFAVVLAVVVVYVLTVRVVAWARISRTGTGAANVERLRGAFASDFRRWLTSWWRWPKWLVSMFRRRRLGGDADTASVRDVYRKLLAWAAAHGYRRSEAETPFEFAAVLASAYPEAAQGLETLTRAYVEVRYGSRVPCGDEVRSLREVWAELRRMDLRKGSNGGAMGRGHGCAGA